MSPAPERKGGSILWGCKIDGQSLRDLLLKLAGCWSEVKKKHWVYVEMFNF